MRDASAAPAFSIGARVRGFGLRQLRMACGLILFSYLLSHFLNHALGNVSLDALAAGIAWHTMFWHALPVAVLFYTAVTIHAGLGLWALYERRQFSRRLVEPLQLALGLSIPLLVYSHLIGIRLSQSLFGLEKTYPQVLYAYFVAFPSYRLWLMLAALLVAWTHGCIGLHSWLRIKPWARRAMPYLLAVAVIIPTLALLGIYQGGRAVEAQAAAAAWRADNLTARNMGTAAQQGTLETVGDGFVAFYLGLIGLVLIGRAARARAERRGDTISLPYGRDRVVRVPKGMSVLEASLRHNIPHASACGGRARCSTCRIRVVGDVAALQPPSSREAFVLARVGVGDDPSIRLACQLRPTADLEFVQAFLPPGGAAEGPPRTAHSGEERYLVSMFVDMRGSTRLAETRLPFDTVFIVNRFLAAVARAVTACGGTPNQFVGDGLLALFGLDKPPREACRDALRAAASIAAQIEELNGFLAHDLSEPIRFGIGIHGGEVIVGDIGTRDHKVFTALGDAVNVAARLQEMTKALGGETVLSDDVRKLAGIADSALPAQPVEIRGRAETMRICVVTDSRGLMELVEDRSTDTGRSVRGLMTSAGTDE